jgi:hypothetical protein
MTTSQGRIAAASPMRKPSAIEMRSKARNAMSELDVKDNPNSVKAAKGNQFRALGVRKAKRSADVLRRHQTGGMLQSRILSE